MDNKNNFGATLKRLKEINNVTINIFAYHLL